MRTIAIIASILAISLSAPAQEIEKSPPRAPVIVNDPAAPTVDPLTRKQIRTINAGDHANVVVVGRSPKEKGEPKTWLGVVLDELSPAVASHLPLDPDTGLIVEHVMPESPAAKAGLQKHDILVRLGDQVLIAPKQLQTLVANRKEGETVEITYLRKGQKQTVTATLATNHPGDGLVDSDATINLHGAKIDIDRLLKEVHDTAGSIILNKKTVFVGPDGKPVTIDSDEIRDKTLKMLEQSGLTNEILDQVKRAIGEAQEQVRKAQDQAKQAVDQARHAAQQARTAAERAAQEARKNIENSRPSEPPR